MRAARPALLAVVLVATGCLSSTARLHDGGLAAEEVVRVTTGEGFWGDKALNIAAVNGTALWQPRTALERMFDKLFFKNDVRLAAGPVELVAGGGQRVEFEGEGGVTYKLSLVDSTHDSRPVLVVAHASERTFVADSEPRLGDLCTAPWRLEEGWSVVDWRRYRTPSASVETDVVLYEGTLPQAGSGAGEPISGPTWMTSIGRAAPEAEGARLALAADLHLDLALDYDGLEYELVTRSPRLERFRGRSRGDGGEVTGFVAVARAGEHLRGVSCVGPGPWADRAGEFAERLGRALEATR